MNYAEAVARLECWDTGAIVTAGGGSYRAVYARPHDAPSDDDTVLSPAVACGRKLYYASGHLVGGDIVRMRVRGQEVIP
jgi:hypothetical protein